ncbi:MAG: allophanate hydrolase [Salaquimonas sp.]|nr:allophanate hydrolase [Salaquimonas sp.]
MQAKIEDLPFTLEALRLAYGEGLRPADVVAEVFRRLDATEDPGIFIHTAHEQALADAEELGEPDGRPLWGIPFAVKDNIDVAGMPTTAACPDFAHEAETDAFVVARLKAAGAIPIGKTNLDQFATGLVGVRTPYAIPRNALDDTIVPGGSSSGSAVAVARGIVAFALGTDTAGSGRVPAALNGIVGLKPTLGALSASGVVPACRTLDAVSIFALTTQDAWAVFEAAMAFDPADAYSRKLGKQALHVPGTGMKIGVPDSATLKTFGDKAQKAAYRETLSALAGQGAEIIELDFAPFYAVADMLYEGAWVAERVAAVGSRLTEKPETLHKTTRAILEPGLKLTAVDAFEGIYRLKVLRCECEDMLAGVDALCVPTIPTFVTMDEIAADPIGPNSMLGTYTNFVNLLDLAGVAVPTGLRDDGRPASVTFLTPAGADALCASLATTVEAGAMGATGWDRPAPHLPLAVACEDEIAVAVCGAHMSGLPLNHELTSRGARFIRAGQTSPDYRFYALAGGPPFRPGLVRQNQGGAAIDLEIWAMPKDALGSFMAGIPAPLSIGTVKLDDGSSVKGFLCESHGIAGASEITELGGWRAYMASLQKPREADQ